MRSSHARWAHFYLFSRRRDFRPIFVPNLFCEGSIEFKLKFERHQDKS